MSEPPDWIDRRLANARLPDARIGRGTGLLLGLAGRAGVGLASKAMGGLWVGGTAYLTGRTVEFHPNTLNRLAHAGGSVGPVILDLAAIDRVDYRAATVTHIVELAAGDTVLAIRGYRMRPFCAAISEAVARDRGGET